MDVLKEKLDQIFKYQLQYHEQRIRTSLQDLETISFNLHKNFQIVNISEFKSENEFELLTDDLALEVLLKSLLLPIFVHIFYFIFIDTCFIFVDFYSTQNLPQRTKTISSKRSQTIKKTTAIDQDQKPAFIFNFNQIAAMFVFMQIFIFHSTDLLITWIAQPEFVCGNGNTTAIKTCLSNITELIDNIELKNEEGFMFITKSIEDGKIEAWEIPVEYYEQLLEDIEDSVNILMRIVYDYDMRSASCGFSIFYQLSSLCCTYIFLKKLNSFSGISSLQVLAVLAGLVMIVMYVYQEAFIPMLVENIHHDSSILIQNVIK